MSDKKGLLAKYEFIANKLKRSGSRDRNSSPSPIPTKRNSLLFETSLAEEEEEEPTESFANLTMEV